MTNDDIGTTVAPMFGVFFWDLMCVSDIAFEERCEA